MGTKLDQKWALGILKDCSAETLERVRALILEVERLEREVDRLEKALNEDQLCVKAGP